MVLVQDIHRNADAQRAISTFLSALIDQRQLGLIALEGAFGPVDVGIFQRCPHQNSLRKVADYLLRENIIQGPMHALLTSRSTAVAVGVDDEIAYRANVRAYREARTQAASAQRSLGQALEIYAQEKQQTFSPTLLALDNKISDYRRRKIGLGVYVEALSRQNGKCRSAPNLNNFLEAYRLETSLDFARVESERQSLLTSLTPHLTPTETQMLTQAAIGFKSGSLSHADFYELLHRLCETKSFPLVRYPSLVRYFRYVAAADRIDGEKLFAELHELEQALLNKLARGPAEQRLLQEGERLYLTEKLLNFSLSKAEWREYKNLPSHETAPSSFERFYQQAEIRDEKMADNLLGQLARTSSNLSVVVAGGFHSSGIAERLVAHGFTVVNWTPRVAKIDSANGSEYLTAFAQEKMPLEKLVKGNPLFLAERVAVNTRYVATLADLERHAETRSPSDDPNGAAFNEAAGVPTHDVHLIENGATGTYGLQDFTLEHSADGTLEQMSVSSRWNWSYLARAAVFLGAWGLHRFFNLDATSLLTLCAMTTAIPGDEPEEPRPAGDPSTSPYIAALIHARTMVFSFWKIFFGTARNQDLHRLYADEGPQHIVGILRSEWTTMGGIPANFDDHMQANDAVGMNRELAKLKLVKQFESDPAALILHWVGDNVRSLPTPTPPDFSVSLRDEVSFPIRKSFCLVRLSAIRFQENPDSRFLQGKKRPLFLGVKMYLGQPGHFAQSSTIVMTPVENGYELLWANTKSPSTLDLVLPLIAHWQAVYPVVKTAKLNRRADPNALLSHLVFEAALKKHDASSFDIFAETLANLGKLVGADQIVHRGTILDWLKQFTWEKPVAWLVRLGWQYGSLAQIQESGIHLQEIFQSALEKSNGSQFFAVLAAHIDYQERMARHPDSSTISLSSFVTLLASMGLLRGFHSRDIQYMLQIWEPVKQKSLDRQILLWLAKGRTRAAIARRIQTILGIEDANVYVLKRLVANIIVMNKIETIKRSSPSRNRFLRVLLNLEKMGENYFKYLGRTHEQALRDILTGKRAMLSRVKIAKEKLMAIYVQKSDFRLVEENRDLIRQLDAREQKIINARLPKGNERPITLQALGAEVGVTKARIRQIEAGALRKLRALKGWKSFVLLVACVGLAAWATQHIPPLAVVSPELIILSMTMGIMIGHRPADATGRMRTKAIFKTSSAARTNYHVINFESLPIRIDRNNNRLTLLADRYGRIPTFTQQKTAPVSAAVLNAMLNETETSRSVETVDGRAQLSIKLNGLSRRRSGASS